MRIKIPILLFLPGILCPGSAKVMAQPDATAAALPVNAEENHYLQIIKQLSK